MKNNRSSVTVESTAKLLTQIGDPSLIRLQQDFGTEGTRSIILLDLHDKDDIELYERLHNNSEHYEVLDEVEHSGRYTVFVTLRYIRKIPWPKDDKPLVSSAGSSKKSKKSRGRKKAKAKAKAKEIGF